MDITSEKDSVEVSEAGAKRSHNRAVVEALFVTVLWASSWVIIKFGLEDIRPLTFAGLRYTVAAIILVGAIAWKKEHREFTKNQNKSWWLTMALYGVVFVAVTQGAVHRPRPATCDYCFDAVESHTYHRLGARDSDTQRGAHTTADSACVLGCDWGDGILLPN